VIDLFRPCMAPEARDAVQDVLTPDPATGRLYIGQGQRVDAFEKALQTFLVSPQDILTVNSCTSALDLALHLCEVGGHAAQERSMPTTKVDIVISTPMTCTATNGPIVTRGGAIVWADIDPLTGLIDPQSVADIAEWLWKKHSIIPNAIMAVDWGGHLADYPALREIVIDGETIPIIQDAAHSFGASVDAGVPFLDTTLTSELWRGHYTCFSFQAIKH
jgi:dTDP-4-amino-4,6-dideoxygalactose transaminase